MLKGKTHSGVKIDPSDKHNIRTLSVKHQETATVEKGLNEGERHKEIKWKDKIRTCNFCEKDIGVN